MLASRTMAPSRPSALPQENCSVGRLLHSGGDGWTFLLLRAAFFGERHFEGFVSLLGAPRARVADSLNKLLETGVLLHDSYGDYRLTEAGRELFDVCVGLMRWGDEWTGGGRDPPVRLAWRATGKILDPRIVCGKCGGAIHPRETTWRDGPGAGTEPRPKGRRRSADASLFARAEPCSVARALARFGDSWSFMILREVFFGVTRFDNFARKLNAPRNVLAKRLGSLVDYGLLCQSPVAGQPGRLEYRLAEAGQALFPTIVAMMHWGDRWLAGRNGPPLILTHTPCGKRLRPILVDRLSSQPVASIDVYPKGPGASISQTTRKREAKAHALLESRQRGMSVNRKSSQPNG